MPPISLLASHHDPHGAPLGDIDRLDHARNFVDEGDGAGHMVENLRITADALLFRQNAHVPKNSEKIEMMNNYRR